MLEIMDVVDSFEELKTQAFPPNVRLHQLRDDRKGEWAIDIDKISGWRITFCFQKNEFVGVKIEDYH